MADTVDYNINNLIGKVIELDPDVIVFYNNLLKIQRRNENLNEAKFLNLELLFTVIKDKTSLLVKDQVLLFNVLTLVHHTIHLTTNIDDVNDTCFEFLGFLKTNSGDVENQRMYLQFVQQILQTFIEIDHVALNIDIFNDSVHCMFSENSVVSARAVICVRILLDHFNYINLLSIIWDRVVITLNVKILAVIFEYFLEEGTVLEDIQFWKFLVKMIESSERSSQKYALFILKTISTSFANEKRTLPKDIEKYFAWKSEQDQSWTNFFIIFDNLLERQSHLILPSLQLLTMIRVPSIWIDILLLEMLKHKNVLVMRWSVKYILESMTVDEMSEKLLKEFMLTLNNTFLYADRSISLMNFISKGQWRYLNFMLSIEWKSVPLHVNLTALKWLGGLYENVNLEFLNNFAIKIRRVQNRRIRYDMRIIFFEVFCKPIRKLCVNGFLKLIESMYNRYEVLDNDVENILVQLLNKSECTTNIKITTEILHIISNRDEFPFLNLYHEKLFTQGDLDLTILLDALSIKNIDKTARIVIKTKIYKFLNVLNLTALNVDDRESSELNFLNLYVYLYSSHNETDKKLIVQHSLALIKQQFDQIGKRMIVQCNFNAIKPIFVDRLTTMLIELKLKDLLIRNVDYFNNIGGLKTFQNVLYALQGNCDKESRLVLDRILMDFKFSFKKQGFDGCRELCQSFSDFCNSSTLGDEYFGKLLNLDMTTNTRFVSFFYCSRIYKTTPVNVLYIINGLLFGEPLQGDQKVEYDYANNLEREYHSDTFEVRQSCFQVLFEYMSKGKEGHILLLEIQDEILKMSIELNKKKPRYFDNSKQHRLKLRMVQAIAVLQYILREWDDRFLITIFNENNQNNVTYIMELVVAHAFNKEQLIDMLSKMSSYSNNALSSVFAITYMVCRKFDDPDLAMKTIEFILPWTMAQHFCTRFNAQIAIFHMLEYFKQSAERFFYLQKGIYASLQLGSSEQNLSRLHGDFRYNDLNYKHLLDARNILIYIPQITNMATDELYDEVMWKLPFSLESSSDKMKYSRHERTISKKTKIEDSVQIISRNVQRKINPMKVESDPDFLFYSDYNIQKDTVRDMIVVASLITKLPNLGGIARTCEVLGIKNLVIESMKHADSKEFQTLSMTAEKWLNIQEVKPMNLVEYLSNKKSKGYQLLGAEQTVNSINLANFQFPEKCILLLGHEKEGIPANMIAILDHAVEIPQFGIVRSLNVHVSGALFMWEYCKRYFVN